MDYKKLFGAILILFGLAIIFWTVFETFNIFTAKKEAPQIFEMITQKAGEEKPLQKAKTLEEKIQALQQEIIAKQLQRMLPTDSIVKLLNLIAWSIGALILFTGGGKIAQIGISLIK